MAQVWPVCWVATLGPNSSCLPLTEDANRTPHPQASHLFAPGPSRSITSLQAEPSAAPTFLKVMETWTPGW